MPHAALLLHPCKLNSPASTLQPKLAACLPVPQLLALSCGPRLCHAAIAVKILRGTYAPLPEQYSPELRELVSALLRRKPDHRPSIDEASKQGAQVAGGRGAGNWARIASINCL